MTDQGGSELQRQIDDLVASLRTNQEAIAGLIERADASEQRAKESDQRADIAESRADEMEARALVDREMIAALQADGVISQGQVGELEEALVSSRTIGAALGILMAQRNIGQAEALMVLKGASSRTNTKMRDLAQTIVAGADAIK